MHSDRNGSNMSTGSSNISEWLHPDQQLAPHAGVTYGVRYVGRMPVKTSIKAVEFDVRTKIGKECIHRVCEEVGLKLPGSRKRDKKIELQIGPFADKQFAMTDAKITITTESITVNSYDDNHQITKNNLFNISFASGGDADTMDYVSYVAKNDDGKRFCFVIECMGGLAKSVISTIGQAFKIRYQEFVSKNDSNQHQPPAQVKPVLAYQPSLRGNRWGDEPDDSLGHIRAVTHASAAPAAVSTNRSVDPFTNQANSRPGPTIPLPPPPTDPVPIDNLLDLDTSKTTAVEASDVAYSSLISKELRQPPSPVWEDFATSEDCDHAYINTAKLALSADSDDFNPRADEAPAVPPPPVLNMPPTTAPPVLHPLPSNPALVPSDGVLAPVAAARHQQQQSAGGHPLSASQVGGGGGGEAPPPTAAATVVPAPSHESWYLGPMSRGDAERLLCYDGDFLVRGSLQQPGQYILSGRQDDKCKHLLLVDPCGQVRTKDRVFDSISHLIQFHIDHGMPIKSLDSELQLIFPITSRETFD